jgi:arylsulfatase A-like enzyme
MWRARRTWRGARALLLAAPLLAAGAPEERPNVLVILADDLGWNDIALHGSQTPTPHIDRLAASGVAFRNLIVSSVCSPTRAAFYTGCDAVRSGYGGEVGDRLNPALQTLAQTFGAAGYRTGLFGKWHNGKPAGDDPWSPTPVQAGFETFEGFYGGGTDYFDQRLFGQGVRNWYVNDRQIEQDPGYLTDRITEGAVRFLRTVHDRPFFCMIAQAAPHEPFQATDALLGRVPEALRGGVRLTEGIVRERSRDRTSRTDRNTWEFGGFSEAERRVVYSAMKIGLDDAVGRLLDTLDQTGLRDRTIVLFFSDNGAMQFIREGNLPFRAWKHDMYDGAIHVPGFLSYPRGGIAAGSTYAPMLRCVDLYPTLSGLAGVPLPCEGPAIDGVSILPALLGRAPPPRLEWNGIFVYYGGYRDDRWKLIAKAGVSELYDLSNDPSESADVADRHPDVARLLRARHEAWLKAHGANVNYAPPCVPGAGEAQPRGEVLEVRLESSATPRRVHVPLPLRRKGHPAASALSAVDSVCTPGDCLIYDMKIERMVEGQAAYLSPVRGEAIVFGGVHGAGVDASGARVSAMDRLVAPPGGWRRYVVGLGNAAAGAVPDLRLVMESRAAGEIRVLVDNIHVVKPNGRVLPVWDGGPPPQSRSAIACRAVSPGPPGTGQRD